MGAGGGLIRGDRGTGGGSACGAMSERSRLEAVKACQEEIEAALQKSLVDTEAVLQRALETLDMERKALESE